MAEKEKSDCGVKRKQESKRDSSSTPLPQESKSKCLGKRTIKAMSETEPVSVRQKEREQINQVKCAGRKTDK